MIEIPFDGEVSALLKVEKSDGSVRYMKVEDGVCAEITVEQYESEGGS